MPRPGLLASGRRSSAAFPPKLAGLAPETSGPTCPREIIILTRWSLIRCRCPPAQFPQVVRLWPGQGSAQWKPSRLAVGIGRGCLSRPHLRTLQRRGRPQNAHVSSELGLGRPQTDRLHRTSQLRVPCFACPHLAACSVRHDSARAPRRRATCRRICGGMAVPGQQPVRPQKGKHERVRLHVVSGVRQVWPSGFAPGPLPSLVGAGPPRSVQDRPAILQCGGSLEPAP